MYTLIDSSFKKFNSLVVSDIVEAMHEVKSCNENWHSVINYDGNKFVYYIAKCSNGLRKSIQISIVYIIFIFRKNTMEFYPDIIIIKKEI